MSDYSPTGFSDDLLRILARAETSRYARRGVPVAFKPRSLRPWLEPLGNLVGLLLRVALGLLPPSWSRSFQDAAFRRLARTNAPAAEIGAAASATRELAARLQGRSGRPAAVLCLFSHPPVTGQWLHLNVELARQSLCVLHEIGLSSRRPQLLVAVDPFALDSFGLLLEGVYAGLMGRYHLGFDRLSSRRGNLARQLGGDAGFERIAWRLRTALRRRGRVALALGGGVPATSRALYAAKEYVIGLRRAGRFGSPGEAFKVLRSGSTDFADFCASDLVGERLKKNAWRMMEAWLIATVTGAWPPEEEAAVDSGSLSPRGEAAFEACARAMGLEEEQARAEVEGLRREFSRETPYRRRLFRFLFSEVAARGTPLLLLPLSHGSASRPRIAFGPPVGLSAASASREEAALWTLDSDRPRVISAGPFAEDFVARNFL